MKKTKKSDWVIKPESPGLWMVKFGGGVKTDQELVEEAESHLIELLRNPYYYEAYQRLSWRRELPTIVSGLPHRKGALARRHQSSTSKRTKAAHRPRKDNIALIAITRYVDNHPEKKAQIDVCRHLVRSNKEIFLKKWPYIRDTEKLAQKLSKAVTNYRRGRYSRSLAQK